MAMKTRDMPAAPIKRPTDVTWSGRTITGQACKMGMTFGWTLLHPQKIAALELGGDLSAEELCKAHDAAVELADWRTDYNLLTSLEPDQSHQSQPAHGDDLQRRPQTQHGAPLVTGDR